MSSNCECPALVRAGEIATSRTSKSARVSFTSARNASRAENVPRTPMAIGRVLKRLFPCTTAPLDGSIEVIATPARLAVVATAPRMTASPCRFVATSWPASDVRVLLRAARTSAACRRVARPATLRARVSATSPQRESMDACMGRYTPTYDKVRSAPAPSHSQMAIDRICSAFVFTGDPTGLQTRIGRGRERAPRGRRVRARHFQSGRH